jgi:S-DNA-T family DNA segregation ATPase FtsK/SpoIIIE
VVTIAGRGTTQGKQGYHFQAGVPAISIAGRPVSAREAAEAIVSRVGVDAAAAKVRMLPAMIGFDEVYGRFMQQTAAPHGQVPFGVSEIGLVPAVVDFAASPHLLLTGRPECGLSTALATIARSVMKRYTPEQARIFVVDPGHGLLRVVEGDHLGGYVYRADPTREMARQVAATLAARLPADDISQAELAASVRRWSGPEIFVFVDGEEMVQDWPTANMFDVNAYALAELVPFLGRAKDVGLHVVVSRRLAHWGKAQMSPLVGPLLGLKPAGVVMDGDRGEGVILRTVRAADMAPGRGIYVTERVIAPVQIAVSSAGDGPLTSEGGRVQFDGGLS